MPVNLNKPERWKEDTAASVDLYNTWFLKFAPETYREQRAETTEKVEDTLKLTQDLRDVSPDTLKANPSVISILRMSTAPPLARDRLVGLSGARKTLVYRMDKEGILPARIADEVLSDGLERIGTVIEKLADRDLFVWLEEGRDPEDDERHRAATVVADRLCGALSDPIIRNAQERRQLAEIKNWLEARGYTHVEAGAGADLDNLKPGTFSFRMNVPVGLNDDEDDDSTVNIPVDVAIARKGDEPGNLPLLIECKSAGDFTNTNKRRKEEAQKVRQLRATYGKEVEFILFLCGYFDSGYLGYEAAEGIDWVWEHRVDDLAEFGV